MKNKWSEKKESENGINNKEEPDTGLSGPDEQSPSLHYKRKWKEKLSVSKSESEVRVKMA